MSAKTKQCTKKSCRAWISVNAVTCHYCETYIGFGVASMHSPARTTATPEKSTDENEQDDKRKRKRRRRKKSN